MDVFISWSGATSHGVATILREWLPLVIQSLRPFVSSEDIEKGTQWQNTVNENLEKSRFGLLCLTRDNYERPWVNFEAGAIANKFDEARVSPVLIDLSYSDVQGPLSQFQITLLDNKKDLYKLLGSMNTALEANSLDEEVLKSTFERWWPDLQERLKELKESEGAGDSKAGKTKRKLTQSEILEEIVDNSRSILREIKSEGQVEADGLIMAVREAIAYEFARNSQRRTSDIGLRTGSDLHNLSRLLEVLMKNPTKSDISTMDYEMAVSLARRIYDKNAYLH